MSDFGYQPAHPDRTGTAHRIHLGPAPITPAHDQCRRAGGRRELGNQGVLRLQMKSAVSAPGDSHEHEAERAADRVAASSRSTSTHPAAEQVPVSGDRASPETAGQPLDAATRVDMEHHLGHGFSGVRIHADAWAARSAQALGARAYTVGRDVVFGAGQFAPHTGEGRRLLAHELTHVVQQGRAGHTRIDRFVEREHKALGNIATTNFPYLATVATDQVALRSSPASHRPTDPFHNLVASLRVGARVVVVGGAGKWLRVIVHSGAALDGRTNQPVDAKGLVGYVSQELLQREAGIFDQNLPVAPGVTLTYGDFTALGGDHFAKFADLENKVTSPGGVQAIAKFIDVVEGRRTGEFEDEKTIDKEWAERYKSLALENISHFSHGGTAVDTWKKQHYLAMMEAAKAGHTGDVSQLQRAYAMNGFADHFLTDSFSSGHVRTPRVQILQFYQQFFDQYLNSILNYVYASIGARIIEQVVADYPVRGSFADCGDTRQAVLEAKQQAEQEMSKNGLRPADLKKLLTQFLGGAVAKVLHDDDNTAGLAVRSRKHPGGWRAFGDGKLDPSFQDYAKEAVQASKDDLSKAVNIGIDFRNDKSGSVLYEKVKPLVYPTSPVEDHIPEVDPGRNRPLREWRIDQDIWKTMDKSVRDELTALIGKYLNDQQIEELIAKVPETLEREITGPNIDVRPKAATRHVLRLFRDDPVGFITRGAATSGDLDKVIAGLPGCR